jgi:hypothetical protein
MGMLWVSHHLMVYYSDYPYGNSQKNHFVNYVAPLFGNSDGKDPGDDLLDDDIHEKNSSQEKKLSDEQEDSELDLSAYKNYFYSIDGGFRDYGENGSGGFVSLRGRFWKFIGPECEAMRIDDGKDHLDYYAIGINIPVFQNSYISPDFYIQAAYMRGVIDLDGMAYGIIINSYPFKPVTLFFRAGQQVYHKDKYEYKFIDIEGRIGLILYRFELFAGYRRVKTEYAELKGPFTGIKFHF